MRTKHDPGLNRVWKLSLQVNNGVERLHNRVDLITYALIEYNYSDAEEGAKGA